MAKPNIITISRTYGSGGKGIGKDLAKRLGYEFLDKEIMRLASEKSGLVEDYFKSDRSPRSSLLYSLAMGLYSGQGMTVHYNDPLSDDKLFEIQSSIIREKADAGNCVFVGRCANYVLRHYPNALHIYIDCDEKVRLERIMQRSELAEGPASKLLVKTDKKRRTYYNYYTSREWGTPRHFDLCINTAHLSQEQAVDLIFAAMEQFEK